MTECWRRLPQEGACIDSKLVIGSLLPSLSPSFLCVISFFVAALDEETYPKERSMSMSNVSNSVNNVMFQSLSPEVLQ